MGPHVTVKRCAFQIVIDDSMHDGTELYRSPHIISTVQLISVTIMLPDRGRCSRLGYRFVSSPAVTSIYKQMVRIVTMLRHLRIS